MSEENARYQTQTETGSMRTSWFDSVTSFLMACILMLGCIVGALFVVWAANEVDPEITLTKPAVRMMTASSGVDAEPKFDVPKRSEVRDISDLPIETTVASLTTAAAQVAESTEDSEAFGRKGKGQSTSGHTGPIGDRPTAGEDIIPRFERWQLRFNAKNRVEYAKQLDFHQIELGVIGGSIQGVDCVSQLSSTPQQRRITDTANEKRLYFMWQTATALSQWDTQLLESADVPVSGRQVLKFISSDLENALAQLELEHAQERGHPTVGEIAMTVFESRVGKGGYSFVVIDQRYRSK